MTTSGTEDTCHAGAYTAKAAGQHRQTHSDARGRVPDASATRVCPSLKLICQCLRRYRREAPPLSLSL